MKVCSSYLLKDEKSNMAVLEVNLISGYIPEKKDLKRLVGDGRGLLKRYEVDNQKVLFYFDELLPEKTCVEFKILREIKVTDLKSGTVRVYDYYEPEFIVTEVRIMGTRTSSR